MLVQLLLVGHLLAYIFGSERASMVLAVVAVMVTAAGWIATVHIPAKERLRAFPRALAAVFCGGGLALAVVTQGVLQVDPWYAPRVVIPLSGMVFANAMNAVSIAAERFGSERAHGESFEAARAVAFRAGLIPITNSLFAVGLVSLPGMMTGQILSGVSPLVAARYQIIVMLMVFAASGIACAMFLRDPNSASSSVRASVE